MTVVKYKLDRKEIVSQREKPKHKLHIANLKHFRLYKS